MLDVVPDEWVNPPTKGTRVRYPVKTVLPEYPPSTASLVTIALSPVGQSSHPKQADVDELGTLVVEVVRVLKVVELGPVCDDVDVVTT